MFHKVISRQQELQEADNQLKYNFEIHSFWRNCACYNQQIISKDRTLEFIPFGELVPVTASRYLVKIEL